MLAPNCVSWNKLYNLVLAGFFLSFTFSKGKVKIWFTGFLKKYNKNCHLFSAYMY